MTEYHPFTKIDAPTSAELALSAPFEAFPTYQPALEETIQDIKTRVQQGAYTPTTQAELMKFAFLMDSAAAGVYERGRVSAGPPESARQALGLLALSRLLLDEHFGLDRHAVSTFQRAPSDAVLLPHLIETREDAVHRIHMMPGTFLRSKLPIPKRREAQPWYQRDDLFVTVLNPGQPSNRIIEKYRQTGQPIEPRAMLTVIPHLRMP